METRRVFIVGNSLFAEALARTLASAAVEVIASAPTPEAALPLLKTKCPDAVIVANASAGEAPSAAFGQFLAAYPDLPIIYATRVAGARPRQRREPARRLPWPRLGKGLS